MSQLISIKLPDETITTIVIETTISSDAKIIFCRFMLPHASKSSILTGNSRTRTPVAW
jgi:hypothetical protein